MPSTSRNFILLSCIVGGVFIASGLLPLGLGVWLYGRSQTFVQSATQTTGVITEMNRHTDSDGTTYTPTFEYQDASGQTHTVVSSWSSNPPAYSVGDPVEVLYDPSNSSQGQIKSFWVQWIGPIISFSCASVPLLLGLILLTLVPLAIWLMSRGKATKATIASGSQASRG